VIPVFLPNGYYPTDEAYLYALADVMQQEYEAIVQAGIRGRPERYVPRPYGLAAALRILAPALVRRVIGGAAAEVMTTTTGADRAERSALSGPR